MEPKDLLSLGADAVADGHDPKLWLHLGEKRQRRLKVLA